MAEVKNAFKKNNMGTIEAANFMIEVIDQIRNEKMI